MNTDFKNVIKPAYYNNTIQLLGLGIFFTVCILNTWVCDDAYITFRSIEQFVSGNGPIWNPHERVQVFTHPLWYLLLSFMRLLSKDVYINVTVISYTCCLATLLLLRKFTKEIHIWFLSGVLLLLSSRGFMDFTTSGLENPLSYLLTALFILAYFNVFEPGIDSAKLPRLLLQVFLVFGLILTNRIDLGVIFIFPILYCLIHFRGLGAARLLKYLVIGLSPLIAWTAFSVIYYGFPFPNTAYAKLFGAKIPAGVLFLQGIKYLVNSLQWDPVVLITTGIAVLLSFYNYKKDRYLAFLGLGLCFHLIYVVRIGGDFMSGRVITDSFLIAVIIILKIIKSIKLSLAASFVLIAYMLINPFSPLKPMGNDGVPATDSTGIIDDERKRYFGGSSLNTYFECRKQNISLFPYHMWSQDGQDFRNSKYYYAKVWATGYFGYYAGLNKIIIDRYALSDPFLARLPAIPGHRVGHFERNLPDGYYESVMRGINIVENLALREFYGKIRIITQGRIFTAERFKTIFLMNIGKYDYLTKA